MKGTQDIGHKSRHNPLGYNPGGKQRRSLVTVHVLKLGVLSEETLVCFLTKKILIIQLMNYPMNP